MGWGFAKFCAGILGASVLAAPVCAQDEDTQLWVYAIATTDLAEQTRLTVDLTARWREQARGDEQQTARFTIMHQVAEAVRLGGGAGVFEAEGGRSELRPHQQMSIRAGRFSARTRVEQRFFDGADRMELRIRQLVRYAQPLNESWNLSVDGEYLGLAQTRNRNSGRARDQWRARVILSADVSERVSLGAGYLLIHTPRNGRADRLNHVPQLYLSSRF